MPIDASVHRQARCAPKRVAMTELGAPRSDAFVAESGLRCEPVGLLQLYSALRICVAAAGPLILPGEPAACLAATSSALRRRCKRLL
jgi:hypothetical protein